MNETTKNLRRWTLIGLGGLIAVALGLMWDASLHAADPDLAASEGPLTLANPSHLLVALGLVAVAAGLSGAAWDAFRPSLRSPGAKVGVASAMVAGTLLFAVGGASALNGGGGHAHGPGGEGGAHPARHGHDHPTLPPYEERYDAATDEERAAADELLAETRAALAAYEDVDAAIAAGYVAPENPHGPNHHYVNRSLGTDGAVLDPTQPEGLVYRVVDGEEPVLLGALFVAPPDTDAPLPAGDLVLWHAHNPRKCPNFFVNEEQPCTDALRMLHVWTVDELTVTPRRGGDTVDVEVVDPFGAPLRASIAPA